MELNLLSTSFNRFVSTLLVVELLRSAQRRMLVCLCNGDGATRHHKKKQFMNKKENTYKYHTKKAAD